VAFVSKHRDVCYKIMRRYYSQRKKEGQSLILSNLKELVFATFKDFENRGFFQESFGYHCVDAGYVAGSVGEDIENYFLRSLRKAGLWPLDEKYFLYSEDDLFDVIELLFDVVSKPKEGNYHSYSDCGWHYSTFEKSSGQEEFRREINTYLQDYEPGYVLSSRGEILLLGEKGLTHLLEAPLPKFDSTNVEEKVELAVLKYRSRHSDTNARREAVRQLADVLEYIRPRLAKQISKKDENDLFTIANNFAIRHHNQVQRTDYDSNWLSWFFYLYLSTIHLFLRLAKGD
jgi:hypothetical protein